MAQLTAFLTYNSSSNKRFLKAVNASVCIFARPSGVDSKSPKKRMAYLRMLTILQWQKAEAKPTNPNSIILPNLAKIKYSFQFSHLQFSLK